jgi:ABC-type antimicrobial peptide transport system permease subunit
VADQKYDDLREAHPPIFFLPSAQDRERPLARRYVIRATTAPAETIAGVSAALASFDPNLAVRYDVLDTQIEQGMLRERLMARLSAVFSGVALVLALVGLSGVVSYTVASRRGEIGVRVALGATRARILGLILGDVGRMLLAGLAAGAVLALMASRVVASLLFGLEPDDLGTLALAAGLLSLTGLVASLWPARQATGIDPITALRE